MDLLARDGSPSRISDSIKDLLFRKSAENIEALRPKVADDLFRDPMNFASGNAEFSDEE